MSAVRGLCSVCQRDSAVTPKGRIRWHLSPERNPISRYREECSGTGKAPRRGSVVQRVTIDVPSVPYPGGRTDAYFFRAAAWNLRNGYDLGGSNLRATVAALLDRVATGLDGAPPTPGGRLS